MSFQLSDAELSLSVDYDESGECLTGLKSVQDDSSDVSWASTFMFVEAGNSAGGGLGQRPLRV